MPGLVYSHPVQSPNLIRRINENRPSLRKSEAKVADFVLSNTNEVITMRIVDLASRAMVSEPTVIRSVSYTHLTLPTKRIV